MARETKPCVKKPGTPAWPEAVNISVKRGLILSAVLFFIPHIIVDAAIYLGLDNGVDSLEDGFNLIKLYSFIAISVFFNIWLIGRIPIRQMLFSRIPSIGEFVIWSGVGLILGSLKFVGSLREGYRFEEPLFFLVMLYAFILKSILFPLVEEPIYRGIILVTLYNWKNNRILAYIGSAFIFLLYHAVDITHLDLHPLGNFHIALIIVFSLIAAYLYDKKGNILLCMLVHGIPNCSDFLGGLFGYLLGIAPPEG